MVCLNKRPETTGQNFELSISRINEFIETAFLQENSTEKCLGCFHLFFEGNLLKLHDQILLQWAEQKNLCILIACLPAAAPCLATGAGSAQCQRTSITGTAGRVVLDELLLPYCRPKANIGAPLLLFLVGIKLLWKTSVISVRSPQGNQQLPWS